MRRVPKRSVAIKESIVAFCLFVNPLKSTTWRNIPSRSHARGVYSMFELSSRISLNQSHWRDAKMPVTKNAFCSKPALSSRFARDNRANRRRDHRLLRPFTPRVTPISSAALTEAQPELRSMTPILASTLAAPFQSPSPASTSPACPPTYEARKLSPSQSPLQPPPVSQEIIPAFSLYSSIPLSFRP
jgi:hypothetical protein